MMNTQTTSVGSGLPAAALRLLRAGNVLPLGSAGGKLEVLHGRVWMTRSGDPDDHFVDFGQSVVVPASGRVLVEALGDGQTALVAWRPGSIVDRVAAALHATFGRCWEIVDAPHRIGAGALATPAVLHNGAGANPRAAVDAAPASRGARADASARPRERARGAAQEAGRGTAGAA